MGYDVYLFTEDVHDELKCPICHRVLEDPVSGHLCDHYYCQKCIKAWLQRSLECPMDRIQLIEADLRPAPKIVTSLLNKLKINCPNRELGCCWTLPLGDIDNHLAWCIYNRSSKDMPWCNSTKILDPVYQMRLIGDRTKDIQDIKTKINQLKEALDCQAKSCKNVFQNVEKFEKKFQQLNNCLQATTATLSNLLTNKNFSEANSNSQAGQESQTVTVYICNLSEFVTNGLLKEYLRQNDILLVDCECEVSQYQRSRDFRTVIYLSDLDKILVSSLWPAGVSVCANIKRGLKNSIVFGGQTKNTPVLKIEAGVTFW